MGPLPAQRMGGFAMGGPSLPPSPLALLGPGPDLPWAWCSCLLPHDGGPAVPSAVDSIPYVSWPCGGRVQREVMSISFRDGFSAY